ncbi:unnamed protein product [Choristocarpus tenellus]
MEDDNSLGEGAGGGEERMLPMLAGNGVAYGDGEGGEEEAVGDGDVEHDHEDDTVQGMNGNGVDMMDAEGPNADLNQAGTDDEPEQEEQGSIFTDTVHSEDESSIEDDVGLGSLMGDDINVSAFTHNRLVPTVTGHAGAAVLGDHILMLGGGNKRQFHGCRHVLAYSPRERTWTKFTTHGAAPNALIYHSVTSLEPPWRQSRNLLVFGGSSTGRTRDNPPMIAEPPQIMVLDSLTMRWSLPRVEGDGPGIRTRHTTVAVYGDTEYEDLFMDQQISGGDHVGYVNPGHRLDWTFRSSKGVMEEGCSKEDETTPSQEGKHATPVFGSSRHSLSTLPSAGARVWDGGGMGAGTWTGVRTFEGAGAGMGEKGATGDGISSCTSHGTFEDESKEDTAVSGPGSWTKVQMNPNHCSNHQHQGGAESKQNMVRDPRDVFRHDIGGSETKLIVFGGFSARAG